MVAWTSSIHPFHQCECLCPYAAHWALLARDGLSLTLDELARPTVTNLHSSSKRYVLAAPELFMTHHFPGFIVIPLIRYRRCSIHRARRPRATLDQGCMGMPPSPMRAINYQLSRWREDGERLRCDATCQVPILARAGLGQNGRGLVPVPGPPSPTQPHTALATSVRVGCVHSAKREERSSVPEARSLWLGCGQKSLHLSPRPIL